MNGHPASDRHEVRRIYDRVAADYDRRWPRYVRDTTRETLARVGPGARGAFLDIACGTGTLLAEVANLRPGADAGIAGVDLSPGMLAEARRKLPRRAILVAGDAARLPFRGAAFGVAVSVSALHHWGDPGAVLGEARRVLEPGGRLVLTDWCGDRWLERLRAALHRRHDHAGLRVYRSSELTALLTSAGFRDVRVERWRSGWRWSLMTATATRAAIP
jgi:ubiquinone/menaquinone biosynthesis C-methylase UbiE